MLMPADEDRRVVESRCTMGELTLFISHSASDVQLAKALTYLFEKALKISARQIRCTSVDGYRLPVGTHTDDQLRREVFGAHSFVGLITPAAVESRYVMFELGSRWGAGRHLAPVLACGADASSLGGPLSGINALRLTERNEVVQLLEDIAEHLQMMLEPSASYQDAIAVVVALANEAPKLRASDKSELLKLVKQSLLNIELTSLRVTPVTAQLGTQLLIEYDIVSTLSSPLEAWLGADIHYPPDQYFYNTTQDQLVTVKPGRHIYSRHLTLAPPLSAGSWSVNGGVWLGKKSDTDYSIRLAVGSVEISVG
jgi:hypothetical protein